MKYCQGNMKNFIWQSPRMTFIGRIVLRDYSQEGLVFKGVLQIIFLKLKEFYISKFANNKFLLTSSKAQSKKQKNKKV